MEGEIKLKILNIKARILSVAIIFSLLLNIYTPVFAASNNSNDIHLNINEMSKEEMDIYQKVLEDSIRENKEKDPNFDEKLFTQQVNYVLYLMESPSGITIGSRSIIKISIPNNVVATAVNIAISLIAGGATTAALRSYILKVGVTEATNVIVSKVTSKLIALGIREVSGIGTVIRTVINQVIDPGSAVAEYLDNHDIFPRNGYVDVRA